MHSVVDFLTSEAGVEAIQKNIDEAGRRGGRSLGNRSGMRRGWTDDARKKAVMSRRRRRKSGSKTAKVSHERRTRSAHEAGRYANDLSVKARGKPAHAAAYKAHRKAAALYKTVDQSKHQYHKAQAKSHSKAASLTYRSDYKGPGDLTKDHDRFASDPGRDAHRGRTDAAGRSNPMRMPDYAVQAKKAAANASKFYTGSSPGRKRKDEE